MKAYQVSETSTGNCHIVFAESEDKAMDLVWNSLAKLETDHCYESFEDFKASFFVTRLQEADGQYRGHQIMDWNDPEDRLFLVKELKWSCLDETDIDCSNCIAKDCCLRYDEWLEIQAGL